MKQNFLLAMGLIVVMLSSCRKEVMLRNELDGGRWKVVKITTSYNNHENIYSPPANFYFFDKEGFTGVYYSDNDSDPITWSVTDNMITITKKEKSLSYTVLRSGYGNQIWERKYTDWNTEVTETYELQKQ